MFNHLKKKSLHFYNLITFYDNDKVTPCIMGKEVRWKMSIKPVAAGLKPLVWKNIQKDNMGATVPNEPKTKKNALVLD